MAITYRAGNVNKVGAQLSGNVAVPATAQAGDVGLIVAAINNATSNTAATPTGWTLLGTVVSSSTLTTYHFVKVLAAGDLGTSVTIAQTVAARFSVSIDVFAGVDNTTPIVASSFLTSAPASATSYPLPSYTTTQTCALFTTFSDKGNAPSVAATQPTGFTADASTGTQTGTTQSIFTAHETLVPSGTSTSGLAWTVAAGKSGGESVTVLALNPAPLSTHGSASGSVAFGHTAAGSAKHRGTASGSAAFAHTASGSTRRHGTSSGSVAFGHTVSGSARHSGSASGSLRFTASALGGTPTRGSASGTLRFAGSASGISPHGGSAGSSVAFGGSAAGSTTRSGSANGSAGFSGAAQGSRPVSGGASGALEFAGSASGSARRFGTASGAVNVAGFASSAGGQGFATGSVVFGGTAHGRSSTVEVSGSFSAALVGAARPSAALIPGRSFVATVKGSDA